WPGPCPVRGATLRFGLRSPLASWQSRHGAAGQTPRSFAGIPFDGVRLVTSSHLPTTYQAVRRVWTTTGSQQFPHRVSAERAPPYRRVSLAPEAPARASPGGVAAGPRTGR